MKTTKSVRGLSNTTFIIILPSSHYAKVELRNKFALTCNLRFRLGTGNLKFSSFVSRYLITILYLERFGGY
jgi:hypothetical protein